MEITLDKCTVRSWISEDAESVARYADNRKIWINLRDAFPHPYTLKDARSFINNSLARNPETFFCIAHDDTAIGSIGFSVHSDVERFNAEIGYWLAEPFWDRGIMTRVLKAVTEYAISSHHLHRIYALPYEWNSASMRVLEKVGYKCEGRMRHSAFKDGQFIDQFLFAFIPE
jgi:RimJ/RimL family protein N-acetyltransferase